MKSAVLVAALAVFVMVSFQIEESQAAPLEKLKEMIVGIVKKSVPGIDLDAPIGENFDNLMESVLDGFKVEGATRDKISKFLAKMKPQLKQLTPNQFIQKAIKKLAPLMKQ